MKNADETPQEYASRRANETGLPYIISNKGHAVVDSKHNRDAFTKLGLTIVKTVQPEKDA